MKNGTTSKLKKSNSISTHTRTNRPLPRSQPASRLIAYYCRQYAIELALPALKTSKDPAAQDTAIAIMSELEKEKKDVGEAFSMYESYTVVRNFAVKVLQDSDSRYEPVFAANKRDYDKVSLREPCGTLCWILSWC